MMAIGPYVGITRITHCCTLIDFRKWMILTDPWFSEKFGYYRGEPLAARVDELPELKGVVISHDHYDHNDMGAFAQYRDKAVPIFAQGAAARRARGKGFSNVTALDTWSNAQIEHIALTAVPALHGVPEIGFILQALDLTVYFAGDTAFIPQLAEIAQRFPRIDIALLPINGLRVLGKQVVMDPVQAAELCAQLRPRYAIPTHYAFKGGAVMDALFLKYYAEQPHLPELFQDAVRERAPDTEVIVLEPGEHFDCR
jgi:L-ascorbate metabolism protein UlaG (beta-lactamase superfamily)